MVIFLVILYFIGGGCLFGLFTLKIASSKGRKSFGFFWLGFFLKVIGVLIAVFLSHDAETATWKSLRRARAEAELEWPLWECAYCHQMNAGKLTDCTRCRREKQEVISFPSQEARNAAIESATEKILKYKQLADLGAITQDEFEAKKKHLLGL